MEMIIVDQGRLARITPTFGIEMQAKHKIGMQLCVHEDGAATDFAVAVKQHFALPSDCLLFFGIVWIENVPAHAGLRQAVFDKDFSFELFEIPRPLRSNRVGAVANVQNCGAQFSQSRSEHPRYPQCQIAFRHRFCVAHLKPALLHLRPFPAEMTGIERDAQSRERFSGLGPRQRLSRAPKSRNMSLRIRIRRKTQSENVVRFAVGKNLRGVIVDLDQVRRDSVCAIDVVDQMREFVVSNGFLIMLEHLPLWFAAENSEVVRAMQRQRKEQQEKGRMTKDETRSVAETARQPFVIRTWIFLRHS